MPLPDSKHESLEKLNDQIRRCKRCRLSHSRIHAICGEGSPEAKFFFIAQAPGEVEDREGKMFLGPTGSVVDELFREIELNRKDVYMTNLIKCILPKNRKPKQDEIETCRPYLDQEIEIIQPEFLFPMGYHATKYILKKYEGDSLPSDPWAGQLIFSGGMKIYPLRHPSAVLHNPSSKEIQVREFKIIERFKEPCKWYPVCPMKYFYETNQLDRKWIERYCKGDWGSCVRYQMEQKGQFHPDTMLPDGTSMVNIQAQGYK
jgi:uracil-DNA glycosylase